MTKLIVAFRNFANAPNIHSVKHGKQSIIMDTVAQCLLQDTVRSTVTAVATKFAPDIRFFPGKRTDSPRQSDMVSAQFDTE